MEAMWKNTNLKRLSMAKCELNLQANSRVLEGFEHNSTLEAINLADNSISEELKDNIAAMLSSESTRLKYLNLANNYLTDDTIAAISVTQNLRSLVLRNNTIKNEGANHIIRLIIHNDHLRRVDLVKNMVSIKYLMEIDSLIEK